MKIPTPKVIPPEKYRFGNCGVNALASAFSNSYYAIRALFVIDNYPPENGISFQQLTKMVNVLSFSYEMKYRYKKNLSKLVYSELAYLYDKGVYIVVFPNHVSCLKDGVVEDGYLSSNNVDKYIPQGWFEIKNK